MSDLNPDAIIGSRLAKTKNERKVDTDPSTLKARGRPIAGHNYKRLETQMSEADFGKLVELTKATDSGSFADVVRLALRVLYVLVISFGKGYDVYLVKRSNPKDKTRLKLF
jgi:hypothetical protein